MTEQDILKIIEDDKWMMDILHVAQKLNLPDWMIGAGFVRNKVWDYLHGYKNEKVPTRDIDLIYFDKNNIDENKDSQLSLEAKEKTGVDWEIVNQAYTHKWHNRGSYKDTQDALADWVEIPTCIAVSMDNNGELRLHASFGIDDLVNLVVRMNPRCSDAGAYNDRVVSKRWKEKWPKLNIIWN
ncbi:MAG: nucleotidyltransferase family protein [Candidatus Paceibacterota bacterium]